MTDPDCCLTVVAPASLEEDLVDHLLEHPHWVPGFVITTAEGSGQSVRFVGVREHVRGRSRRILVRIVMRGDDARALIESLRQAFGGAEIFWWLTPVLASGGLS